MVEHTYLFHRVHMVDQLIKKSEWIQRDLEESGLNLKRMDI